MGPEVKVRREEKGQAALLEARTRFTLAVCKHSFVVLGFKRTSGEFRGELAGGCSFTSSSGLGGLSSPCGSVWGELSLLSSNNSCRRSSWSHMHQGRVLAFRVVLATVSSIFKTFAFAVSTFT